MVVVLRTVFHIGLEEGGSNRLHEDKDSFEITSAYVDKLKNGAEAEATLNLSQPEPAHPPLSNPIPVWNKS